jgi:hypothetical protein
MGGVLSVNVNPGSGKPIGGQGVALKCWGRTVDQMLLREPAGLKSSVQFAAEPSPLRRLVREDVVRDEVPARLRARAAGPGRGGL